MAVFTLMTAESALIPIPSEVTMSFAGFLASRDLIGFWPAVLTGAFANLTGSLIAYFLGYKKGEKWVLSFIAKWGKWILLKEEEYYASKKWLKKYGPQVSFFSRLLPIVRTYISLPAGIARINVWTFSVYTLAGSFIWSLFLTYLGLALGQNWMVIEPFFRKVQFSLIAITGALLAIFLWRKYKKRTP